MRRRSTVAGLLAGLLLISAPALADEPVETPQVQVIELNQNPVAKVVQEPDNAEMDKSSKKLSWATSISERYGVPLSKALKYVNLAFEHERQDFPKAKDILAVIGIESSFRENAVSSVSSGLMQINYEANRKVIKKRRRLFDPLINVAYGSNLLNEYYSSLGRNKAAAVMAYNVGIGNYLWGKRSYKYLARYTREVTMYN